MKNWRKAILLIIFLAISSYLFIGLHSLLRKPSTSSSPTTTSVIPAATSSAQAVNILEICHIREILPDPSCTPGAIDQKVTQDNIKQTICVKGYTKTVRPPVSYTNKLKIQQIAAYGYLDKNPRDYEEDHLISL